MFHGLLRAVFVVVLIGAAFAAIPSGAFAFFQRYGAMRWSIQANELRAGKRLRPFTLLLAGWAGSCIGVCMALNSILPAARWDLHLYPHLLRDGQGGFAIIFSCPFCGMLGATLAILSCRFLLCSTESRLWIAPWLYSGSSPGGNKAVFLLTLSALLGFLWLAGFLANWALLHPGPF
jgi:hypothetical protein